ncbi:molybdenum cofactor sulfurase [Allostella vacuolata]|nr:molybdenum cofactor sulfurase [Stella vacuolata]
MSAAASVLSVWRYPVSSMGGERLDRAEVGPGGIGGDRLWGVVDADGEIASPKRRRWRATPHVRARLGADGVELQLPDGTWRPGAAPETDAALAGHFTFPVRLVRHPSPDLPPGTETVPPRYDVRALHLVTTASLATLDERLPDRPGDPRRFRPNLVVDWPDRALPFPESEWPPGLELEVGGARLRVLEPCRRCAFVTIAQPGIAHDPAVLDLLARSNRADFGALLAVVRPGPVAAGDPVRIAG